MKKAKQLTDTDSSSEENKYETCNNKQISLDQYQVALFKIEEDRKSQNFLKKVDFTILLKDENEVLQGKWASDKYDAKIKHYIKHLHEDI